MSTLLRARAVLLAVLVAFSILPGCGKKNDNNGVIGGPVGFVPIGSIPGGYGSGGCVTLPDPNVPVTLTFAGTLVANTSSLQAHLGIYGTGANTGGWGAMYNHSNVFGDSINIYVSGQSAYAVVTLAQATVANVVYYNSGQICGLYMNSTVVPGGTSGSGWTGNFGGNIYLTRNGTWVVTSSGQAMAL